jgi:thermitase
MKQSQSPQSLKNVFNAQNIFVGTIFLAVVAAGAYKWTTELSTSGEIEMASKSSNKRPLLDKGDIVGKTQKVDNEPKVIMNDKHMTEDWGKPKVDAEKAWAISKGSKDIVVAVIDTGCDVHHEDLKSNIWINPGEMGLDSKGRDKATNGIDDDGNGYIDDVNGWNFVSNDNRLTDNHGHGTHIAGIIGAQAGNGIGIAGVSPEVSLMCLKYFDPKVPGTDNLRNTVQAMRYAIKMGAQIINYSGGGTEPSAEEKAVVEEANKAGILFIAAAGNERSNSDRFKYYPADYGLSNIISVTAIDPNTSVLPSSNYGVETVDIAAPGQNILSTLPGNSYGFMTGTSQATAFVTGAAVLVKAQKNLFAMDEVKKYILDTGSVERTLVGKSKNYRLLNLYNALVMKDRDVLLTGGKLGHTGQQKDIFAIGDNSRNINSFGQKLMLKIEDDPANKLNKKKQPRLANEKNN